MAAASENLAEQLTQFGTSQLNDLSSADISKSTIHLILATAYFAGVTIHFSKPLQVSRQDYLKTLTRFLAKKFGLSIKNAKGSVESNARLYKRFILIEKCYNHGWTAAQSWIKKETDTLNSLTLLLSNYQDLSMSDLSIEGVKKEKIKQPPKPEPEPLRVKPEPETPSITKPEKTGRPLFWFLFVLWSVLIAYVALNPQLIPPEIHAYIQSLSAKISHIKLPF